MLEIPKSQFSLGAKKTPPVPKPSPVVVPPIQTTQPVPIPKPVITPAPQPVIAPIQIFYQPPPATPPPVPVAPPPKPIPPKPKPIIPPPDPKIAAAKQAANQEKYATAKEKTFYGVGCVYELTKWLVSIAILISLIHFFVATIFIVDGRSMEPNFHSNEIIIADRWHYLFGTPKRGDVSVLKFPGDPEKTKYIKRIIGLPGENVIVKDGGVFINGKQLTEPYLPKDMQTLPNVNRTLGPTDYFLMGDNRSNSSDSRIWGFADKRFLIGKAWVVLWPKDSLGLVPVYQYY